MEKRSAPSSSFTSAMSLTLKGLDHVPGHYVLPLSHRPNHTSSETPLRLPIIDLSCLHQPSLRPLVIDKVRTACKQLGFFQVVGHGIPPSVITEAIEAATDFFDMPIEEKMHLESSNVHNPVRYGTSMNHVKDKVYFWRDFIKHYSHPLQTWINQWPSNPPSYKEKMGNYAKAAHMLQNQLIELVFESLGLNPKYLHEDIEAGAQVLAVNCYPACPEPDLVLGMPPHSDYGSLTILLQSREGLEIMDQDKKWHHVPVLPGSLIIQLGDQMEVISNGHYKSTIHRATVNMEKRRISIASLHSLGLNKKVGPAMELVDEQHPMSYSEGSFNGFLHYISGNDIMEKSYIETLKKNPY
ncbi:flavanone 3-dioxygenase 3-like [Impatiens glandulifera]|uniref:flavanone 3-dioxygenase 3-like n=1 Tax=Impatiens glandulifera TaxID=253017 RepID=UPI001FB18011|nr:flavanone 3-dioxygenase 3-like [Impatiens glandulifera]